MQVKAWTSAGNRKERDKHEDARRWTTCKQRGRTWENPRTAGLGCHCSDDGTRVSSPTGETKDGDLKRTVCSLSHGS